MENEEIRVLLEKYWAAETTLDEEKRIADYFRGGEVDPSLEPYRAFFDYIGEEAAVVAPEGFEERMLERLTERGPVVRRIKFGYAAAAAITVCIISVFLVVKQSGAGEITDTYDDPEKAFAAVQRALLVASSRMNEGEKITQKNMHRLNNNFNAYEQLK
ncbi:hypothetical protein ACQ86N_31615 [Puia sp. P3]|uniref:hypothetical protein n=1 Tax=Puia sp. P3 TaxID=3423952 RepID=UPI003D66CCDC